MILAFHFDAISLHSLAQVSATRMVDCIVEGTLVAAFAALLLQVSGRWNSSARFAVWFGALAAIAALPLVGAIHESLGSGDGASAAGLARAEIMLPGSWALWLFGAWAVSAGVGLARVGVGLWRLRGLRRSCVEVDAASLKPELQLTLALRSNREPNQNGFNRVFNHSGFNRKKTRSAALCLSDRVSVPTVIGFVNPAVVIPRWLMQELSPAELKQVLLHELAHLRRWDDWTNLAQKVLKALLFFHPAVWWIERQLSLEREMACDDAVVAETANARAYAECLTHLAEKSFVRRSLALAQAALGRIRQTSLRVAQLLATEQPRAMKFNWKPATVLVVGFAIAGAGGISRIPRLVGFEDGAPASTQIAKTSALPAGTSGVIPAVFSSQPIISRPIIGSNADNVVHPEKAKFESPATVSARSRRSRLTSLKSFPQNSEVAQAGPSAVESSPLYWNVVLTNTAAATPPGITSDLLYPPNSAAHPTAVTEAVFLIFETRSEYKAGSTGAATYRISIWRVVVQAPTGSLNTNTIPHKET